MNYLNKNGLIELWTKIKEKLEDKVNKEEGKQLSSNDFTNEEKSKLENFEQINLKGFLEAFLIFPNIAETTNLNQLIITFCGVGEYTKDDLLEVIDKIDNNEGILITLNNVPVSIGVISSGNSKILNCMWLTGR